MKRFEAVRSAWLHSGLLQASPPDDLMMEMLLSHDPTPEGAAWFESEVSDDEATEIARRALIQMEAWLSIKATARKRGSPPTKDEFESAIGGHEMRALARRTSPSSGMTPKEVLRSIGFSFQGHLKGSRCDTFTSIHSQVQAEASRGSPTAHNMRVFLSTQEGQHTVLGATMWAACGFPVVRVEGHKYAAALMATRLSEECRIEPPWPAFVIDIPRPLLEVLDDDGRPFEVCSVLVERHEVSGRSDGETRVWSFIALSADSGPTLWSFRRTLRELVDEENMMDLESTEGPLQAEDQEYTSRDGRLTFLIARLVLGTCLAASSPDALRQMRPRAPSSPATPSSSMQHFRLTAPVKIDCREAIRGYANHGSRSPSVRWMVRGHWRNQACGPAMKERRAKWIEPYWKGPDGAPAVVRPHVLDSNSDQVVA